MLSFLEHRKLQESSTDALSQPDEGAWKRWRQLANMTKKEYATFTEKVDSDIKGAENVSVLSKMLAADSYESAVSAWDSEMWKLCRNQASTVSRIKKMRKRMVGNPFERDGKKTRWLKSQMIYCHDPRK